MEVVGGEDEEEVMATVAEEVEERVEVEVLVGMAEETAKATAEVGKQAAVMLVAMR